MLRKIIETIGTRYLIAILNLILLFINARTLGAAGVGSYRFGGGFGQYCDDVQQCAERQYDCLLYEPPSFSFGFFTLSLYGLFWQVELPVLYCGEPD